MSVQLLETVAVWILYGFLIFPLCACVVAVILRTWDAVEAPKTRERQAVLARLHSVKIGR